MSFLDRLLQLFRGAAKKADLPRKTASASAPASTKRQTVPQSAADVDAAIRERRVKVVRKREFDKLRALRLHEMNHVGRPKQNSFYASIMKPAERASTIKKIDEIEAQMSMQWWKTDRLDSPNPP